MAAAVASRSEAARSGTLVAPGDEALAEPAAKLAASAGRPKTGAGAGGGVTRPPVPHEYEFALTDSAPTVMRSERVAEEVRAAAEAELTFKPKINVAKAARVAGTFLDRENEWLAKRESRIASERAVKAESELDGCSFKPRINPRSKSMVSSRSARGSSMQERMAARAARKAAKEKKMREAEAAREAAACTFKPKISRKAAAAKARYSAPARKVEAPAADPQAHHPRINELPESFVSAKMYLDQPAHERLACSRALSRTRGPAVEPADRGRQRSRRMQPSAAGFDSFWKRQQETVARRQKSVAALEAEQAAALTHQPVITAAASKLVASTGSSSFISRYYSSAAKRELSRTLSDLEAAGLGGVPAECTFRPRISRKAAKRAPRTVQELSHGDLAKRKAEQAAAAAALEAEKDDELTFEPALNLRANARVQGALRVRDDPHSYVERVERARAKREASKRAAAAQRAAAELEDCTFRPRVHDAPEYVKRIAASRRVSKSLVVAGDADRTRPSWQ